MKRDSITKMAPNRDYDRKAGRFIHEKCGSAEKFRQSVDKWRMANGMEPMYRKENKKSPIDCRR